ncbi:MAG TPA: bifunctional phosphoglucose/phosphomannose isomerase [Anaerolineae bacterium]|nr:bifunctional phosphoglucose/phosphomannose isomerase [Anaerolineae bacterium]
MTEYDDLALMRRLDPQDMLGHVARLPEQCRDAWEGARGLDLPPSHRSITRVLVAAMGGSAIGGDLAAAAVANQCRAPILVHRDYGIPAYADPQTLVIACSYSGETEETLSAFEAAHRRGCPLVAVATGGTLARQAAEWGAPLLRVAYQSQPRAALGYLLVSMLGILRAAGAIDDPSPSLDEALGLLEARAPALAPESPLSRNPAKQLAASLAGRVPLIAGSGALAPVARRWKGQVNENCKGWACFEVLPEMDHNTLAGVHFPAEAVRWFTALFLHPEPAPGSPSRADRRVDLTRQHLQQRGIPCHDVPLPGESPLAQILSAVQLGDYMSCYLAFRYGADPTELDDVVHFKHLMAQG